MLLFENEMSVLRIGAEWTVIEVVKDAQTWFCMHCFFRLVDRLKYEYHGRSETPSLLIINWSQYSFCRAEEWPAPLAILLQHPVALRE